MIVNVRGTSGSGKSTLVRTIMDFYDSRLKIKASGRSQPLGYLCTRKDGRSLVVLGHYETACGGCDTISGLDRIFALVRKAHHLSNDVLFEGLLINSDRNRTIQLHEDGLPLVVVTLDTPIEVCIDSIMERRKKKAAQVKKKAKPLNPRNTETKYKLAKVNHEKFMEAGMAAFLCSREQAACTIEEALELA